MNKIARIIINTQCNLSCSYCCNKLPEIQSSFKMITMDQFIENCNQYKEINITGGEPTLVINKLLSLLSGIKTKNSDIKLYLYTNGNNSGYETNIAYYLDGVNIGIHNNFNDIKSNILVWKSSLVKSIRLHIQDKKCTKTIFNFCKKFHIPIKTWKMNDCNNTQEDRFII